MGSAAVPARLGGAFALIWTGRSLSLLGGYVQYLALPLWIRQVSGSTVAGLLALGMNFVPQIVCAPFAGVLADRFDRRRLVIAVDLAAFAVAASLALGIDPHRLGWVYPHLVLLQVLSALSVPAFLGMLPDVVPAGRLLAANSLLNVSAGASVTIGPLLGTTLLTHSSITVVVWINALSYLVAAACMLPKAPGSAAHADAPGLGQVRTQLWQGLTAVRTDPVLRATVAAEAPWNLCFGAASELVLMHFGATALKQAPGLFGLGAGLGSLSVTLVLARIRREVPAATLFVVAVLGTAPVALAVAWLAADGAVWCVVLAGLLLGVHAYLIVIGPTLHCQQRPARHLRGRVTAVRRAWKATWQLAGIGAAALLTQWLPVLAVVAGGGVLATAAAIPWAWRALRADGPSRTAGSPGRVALPTGGGAR
ncbi:MFS transporter [Streptomyces sp. 1331.2]|uniref:MFS transporter n=1 Tax=Streptomyces sp. 1331.2 TaxID=1938835 RepID=UPI000BD6EE72|nr:MFS transporter [Streptomyces sp. 1331.2]SOB82814.1 Major Facilitator Superfamily protein [Streptomyces sp. 1331.2]